MCKLSVCVKRFALLFDWPKRYETLETLSKANVMQRFQNAPQTHKRTKETLSLLYMDSKCPDPSAHPHSLIRAFAVCQQSVDTIECINKEQMPGCEFAHGHG